MIPFGRIINTTEAETVFHLHEMLEIIREAADVFSDRKKWNKLVKQVMDVDFSWNVSAEKYAELYRSML